uniref:Uncharacterized protein n=2 Tax=Guillardia theta (strain CCMP2712) TaxID=905079 RepID=A0A0C3SH77_GUITC
MESKGAVSERTPLLGGASIVSVTAPDIINRAAESPAPGISLRESVERGKASGLVNDGYREEEEPVCCGQEQLAYSILARLPAIHTYAFLAFFLYFGHTSRRRGRRQAVEGALRRAWQAKFWDPTVIPEDWHMYFRCSMADQGKVEVTRLMILVGTEAVEGKNYVDTVKECYDQSV